MEKHLFEIQNTKSLEYPYIIFSRDSNTMSDYITDVVERLNEEKYEGIVLFDLLLSNGFDDRYYTLIFNNGKFDYKSMKKTTNIPSHISILSGSYYKANIKLLKTSILTKSQIFRLVRKMRLTNFRTKSYFPYNLDYIKNKKNYQISKYLSF